MLRGLIPVLDSLRDPAESLPLPISYGTTFDDAIHAYGAELTIFARQPSEVTSYTYNGKPAIRVTGTTKPRRRRPASKPGQAGATARRPYVEPELARG